MARKEYSEEFRRQAVDLFETTPGATFKAIAADLGIARGTLRTWVEVFGRGTRAVDDPPAGASPGGRPGGVSPAAGRVGVAAVQIARLEAELRAERAERRKLETERDILRSAAKYFAGETRW
jgi:transposase